MKSFTNPVRPPVEFQLNGETYRIRGVVPAGVMVRLMNMAVDTDGSENETPEQTAARVDAVRSQMGELMDFIGDVLDDDSAAMIRDRIQGIGGPAVEWELLMGEVLPWLVEEISGRPTALPSGSPHGQQPTGTTSTGSAPSEGSTPEPSRSTGS